MINFKSSAYVVGVIGLGILKLFKVFNNHKKECIACEAELSPDTLHTKPSPLHTMAVADTELKCIEAINQIMSDCSESEHRVVGVDAEWNHKYGLRAFGSKIGKVLIVSICSPRGYCAIFRMNKLDKIPISLKDFLKDDSVAKVGIGIETVAMYLWKDFKIQVQRYADLRSLAMLSKSLDRSVPQPLAKEIFDIYVNRDASDFDNTKWLAEELSTECIAFATRDVYASIEIHKKLVPTWLVRNFENMTNVENNRQE